MSEKRSSHDPCNMEVIRLRYPKQQPSPIDILDLTSVSDLFVPGLLHHDTYSSLESIVIWTSLNTPTEANLLRSIKLSSIKFSTLFEARTGLKMERPSKCLRFVLFRPSKWTLETAIFLQSRKLERSSEVLTAVRLRDSATISLSLSSGGNSSLSAMSALKKPTIFPVDIPKCCWCEVTPAQIFENQLILET